MNKHRRDCIRLCQQEGLTVHGIEHRGKHWAVVCAEGSLIFPCTPSDGRRWRCNMQAVARRLARNH